MIRDNSGRFVREYKIINLRCNNCGKIFIRPSNQKYKHNFCSKKCYYTHISKKILSSEEINFIINNYPKYPITKLSKMFYTNTNRIDSILKKNGIKMLGATHFNLGHKPPKSAFKKGCTSWIKGLTKDTDERVRISSKKISKSKKGIPSPLKGKSYIEKYGEQRSKNILDKMRIHLKGRKGWSYGLTKETDERIKRSSERMKINNPMKTQENRNKMSLRRKTMILPVKDTKIEVKIQKFLEQLGIEYFAHKYIKEIEHGYQCDIFVPSMNLVIECDGDYWHSYPTGREIDHIRTSELLSKGFRVLRLWEREIKIMGLEDFKVKIQGGVNVK